MSWKADTSYLNLTLTSASQTTLEAAAENAAAAKAISFRENLGGTLIYVLDGNKSVAIIDFFR